MALVLVVGCSDLSVLVKFLYLVGLDDSESYFCRIDYDQSMSELKLAVLINV
jgi:hypothetical protein